MRTKIVLIGASTGGPGHLKRILSALPSSFKASVIIAQHMNSAFIPSFISQFQSELPLKVSSIDKTCDLEPSHVYFCPMNCVLHKNHFTLGVEPRPELQTPYNPNIYTLFLSAVAFLYFPDLLPPFLIVLGLHSSLCLSLLQE